MIRINLNPLKEKRLLQWGQRQVLIYASAVVASLIICIVWAQGKPDPEANVKKDREKRTKIEKEITTIEAQETCDIDALGEQIEKEKKKNQAILNLKTLKKSPVFVLHELSMILSASRGPTIKQSLQNKDKRTLFNQNWDPSSLWITKLTEKDRRVEIEGGAKTMYDIAEFEKRMKVSAFFYGTRVRNYSRVAKDSKSQGGEAYLKFSLVTGANY